MPAASDLRGPASSKGQFITLVLRVLMETGIVAAFGYWGFHAGTSTVTRLVLAVGVPAAGFGFWGAVDFRQAGRLAEPLRLLEELVISGLAALALYAAGQHVLAWALAGLSAGYHALVYMQGGRLLRRAPGPAPHTNAGAARLSPPTSRS